MMKIDLSSRCRKLGEGDLGATWEIPGGDDGPLAIKVPHARYARCYEVFAELTQDLARRPLLPGVLPVLEVGWDESVLPHAPYAVAPLCPWPTLAAAVEDGQVDGARALRLVRAVAETLHGAHAHGLCHGDLHPNNVFVVGADACAIGDFASARVLGAAREAKISVPRSYPACAFLATEVYEHLGLATAASDLFSLGALLWFALTGRPPERPLPAALPKAVPPVLAVLLRRLLSPEPERRPTLAVVLQTLGPRRRIADIDVLDPLESDTRWQLFAAERGGERLALRLYPDHAQRPGRAPLSAAQLLRGTALPHLARVRDCGIADERAYVLLEPLPEARLAGRDRDRRLGRAAYGVALQILSVLRGLHSQEILYLGLCPDTVALRAAPAGSSDGPLGGAWDPGDALWAVVLDSETVSRRGQRPPDLARTMEAVRLDQASASVLYLAPELCDGQTAIGPAADVYALGALLYFMLTGAAPVRLAGPPQASTIDRGRAVRRLQLHAPEAPTAAELLIEQMLAAEPERRPSLDDVEHQLRCLMLAAALLAEPELGAYRLLRVLAFGGMSVVLEAERRDLPAGTALRVVVKAPLPQVPAGRVEQEIDLLQKLPRHPGLVQMLDILPLRDGRKAMVLERLDGVLCGRGPLPLEEVIAIGVAVSGALCAAHKAGVVHRDIKLDNLVRVSPRQVKVIDFGVAMMVGAGPEALRRTAFGATLGTDLYMAPEQRGDARSVDGRADVYSLGVVLFELLTGQHPDEADLALVANGALRALLGEMLARQRERRPSMAQVERRLRGLHERRVLYGRWAAAVSGVAIAGLCYTQWPSAVTIAVDQEVDVYAEDGKKKLGSASQKQPFHQRHKDLQGHHTVLLRRAGFHEERVELTPGRSQREEFVLQPSRWDVRWFAGRTAKVVPIERYPDVYRVEIELKATGYKIERLTLSTLRDERHEIHLTHAELTIRSATLGAHVVIGEITRSTPYTVALLDLLQQEKPPMITVKAPRHLDQQIDWKRDKHEDRVVQVELKAVPKKSESKSNASSSPTIPINPK